MEDYIYWAVTGVISVLGGAVAFFLKRGMDRTDKRIAAQEDRMRDVEGRLGKAIADMPFVYTTREDFIRATASIDRKLDNTDRKIDQILKMVMRNGGAED